MDAGEVYRRLAPSILGYLRGQGAPDPEDVLGEVFFHVARSLPRFRGDDEDLRRWVFTIARNRLIDDRRRRGRRPEAADVEVPEQPVELPDLPDGELLAALGALTEDQREVVVLRFVVDLSLEAVAEVSGRSVGAVKAMQHRALGQLARTLGATRSAEHSDG